MSYEANLSMTVVRTRHVVKFYQEGTLASSLKGDLANVPDEAALKDIEEDGNTMKLIFEIEKPGE